MCRICRTKRMSTLCLVHRYHWTILAFGIAVFSSSCVDDNCIPYDGVCNPIVTWLLYRGGVPAKSPDKISGLKLWLKADAGASNTGWLDQSGNTNNVSGTATLVTNAINGQPAMRFNATSNEMSNTSTTGLNFSAFSFLTVFRRGAVNTTVAHTFLVIGAPAASGRQFRLTGLGSNAMELVQANTAVVARAQTAITSTTAYNIGVLNYGANGAYAFFLNGNPDGNGSNLTTFSGTSLYVGSRGATEYYDGDIAEIIVYDNTVSDSDRQGLECYLSRKYGINVNQICL